MGSEQRRPFDEARAAPNSVEGRTERDSSAGTGDYLEKVAATPEIVTTDHAPQRARI